MTDNLTERLPHPFTLGNNAIRFCAYAYGIYALFVLVECIDFLALLHTAENGFHATYTIVHVAFFIVELIICTALTLGLLIMFINPVKKPSTVIAVILIITVVRVGLVYYLYWYSEPKVHFVPYIYKKANELSGITRSILLPTQIISGFICAWIWTRLRTKTKVLQ